MTAPHTLAVTLHGVRALARRRSPLVVAARASIDQVRARLEEARAAWVPSIEATGFATVVPTKREDVVSDSVWEQYDWTDLRPLMTAQVTLSQPLYTFGKIDALAAMARQGIHVAAAAARIVEAELDLQVARAYWGLVMAHDLEGLIERGRRELAKERIRLEALRDNDDENFDAADLLRLRVMELEFEDRVRSAQRAKALAQDALRFAVNLDAPWTLVPADRELPAPSLVPMPMAAYETVAVANHPRELVRRRGETLRLEQLRYERAQLLPDLVLTGRVAYTYAPSVPQSDDSLADNPTNPTQSGAGLALRWRLDVFRQWDRIQQHEASARQERARNDVEQQRMRSTVRDAVRQMIDLGAMTTLHDRAVDLARSQMTAALDMADNGLGSRADALKAVEQYIRRRLSRDDNLYRYHVAVATLGNAIGVDPMLMNAPRRPDKSAAAAGAEYERNQADALPDELDGGGADQDSPAPAGKSPAETAPNGGPAPPPER